jgi:hypothetical protein
MAEHLLAPQGSTSEIVRVEWGVMDDDCRVTECPNGHVAGEHQATRGGVLVIRETIRTIGW